MKADMTMSNSRSTEMDESAAPPDREAWDRIARGYDALVTPSHMVLATEGLRLAGVTAGTRVLDVACGSGALAVPAARLGARVTAVDISPAMIAKLAARIALEGLEIEARVMDGHALDLADDSFDVAASQWGVMLFPDFARGLREMVRVTRPSGRVLLHVFGAPQEVEFLSFFLGAMAAAVPGFPGLPLDPPPLPFQASEPAKLRDHFERAGLRDIRIQTVTESLYYRSGQELWDWLMSSNPIAGAIAGDLSPEQAARVIEELETRIRARAGGPGIARLTVPVHIAIGTV
jgi:ubiquinone/menaquinone biosynthesis C-methylase UbiE